jgi:3'-phosphoadenosine 5'-phosphosulfate sulfotransferase (PAPS reductase)/FAD synthetase
MKNEAQGVAPLERPVRHLVLFSGGACSWAAAKRVVERHGTDGVVLLFADTMMEDEDLYRFIDQAAANVGAPLVRIADGRTPWQVMRDERMMGGGFLGADPCSRILKRELLNKWQKENCDPETTTIHIGLDWTEQHRIDRVQERCKPWRFNAPMAERPLLSKADMLAWMTSEGIEPPRLYKMGFAHNNCGGFCVKAGQAQFERLYRTMPDRYRQHERAEAETRAVVGDYTILTYQRSGKRIPITLREFRERIEAQPDLFDAGDWGGCGCAIDA